MIVRLPSTVATACVLLDTVASPTGSSVIAISCMPKPRPDVGVPERGGGVELRPTSPPEEETREMGRGGAGVGWPSGCDRRRPCCEGRAGGSPSGCEMRSGAEGGEVLSGTGGVRSEGDGDGESLSSEERSEELWRTRELPGSLRPLRAGGSAKSVTQAPQRRERERERSVPSHWASFLRRLHRPQGLCLSHAT